MKRFIVVVWYGGIPYMLQYRGVANWYFDNNHIKLFKTKETAIKNAYKLTTKYHYDRIKVYSMNEGEMVSTDVIRKWENEQAERIEFELVKVTTNK